MSSGVRWVGMFGWRMMLRRPDYLARLPVKDLECEVMPSEEAVGRAMLDEIESAVAAKADRS